MNAPDRAIDWTQLNQRLLAAEFRRLAGRLAADKSGTDDSERDIGAEFDDARAGLAALARPAALDTLVDAFGLSGFERDLLLLTAGVEMDTRLAALCADAQGDPRRPWATLGVALAHLAEPHWSALSPLRPWRRWRLVEVDTANGLVAGRLSMDERLLHFLIGVDYLDPRLEPLTHVVPPPLAMAASHAAIGDAVVAQLGARQAPLPLVHLHGADRHGCEDIAAACAARLGLRLLAIDCASLAGSPLELAALAALCEREAVLSASAWLVDGFDEPPSATALQMVGRMHGVVFLVTGDTRVGPSWPASQAWGRPVLEHAVPYPDRVERRQLWRQALGDAAESFAQESAAVSAQFVLSARSIGEKAAALELQAGPDDAPLWRACRAAMPGSLHGLAQRIEPAARWADLVLPDAQMQTLHQIAVHMRHRHAVYDDWGFAGKGTRGLGISALFAGESGTGKTMAAEVLANVLKLTLYRIDLSSVVSKYIGETEKHLRQVFDAAEGQGAMLLFDEADALFGKRSEVKDSHDRYANIEVGYLLQRMEAFQGLAILTTNHKAALDTAFTRRLRFVVPFAFPDQAQREAIWRASFPPQTPLESIDWARLARLNATGGTIHNIALAAAFLAAENGTPVGMAQLLRAAHLDAAKRDKPLTDAETRGWI